MLLGLAIGIPLYSFSSQYEKYGIVSVLAPILEELLFGSFVLLVVYHYTKSVPAAWIASIVTFTAFHYFAYGASFAAASASFLGAAIYRALGDYVNTKDQKNLNQFTVPIAGIVAHAIINTYLIIKLTGFIVVGI